VDVLRFGVSKEEAASSVPREIGRIDC